MADGIYREVGAATDLSAHVQCVWYRRIGPDEASRPVRIVPDGCTDLLWRDGKLLVAGPDTTVQVSHLLAGTEIVGLRFRPGVGPSVLGVPATDLVDERLDAVAVWGRSAAEVAARIEGVHSPAAAAAVLQDAVRRRLAEAPTPDLVVQHVVVSLLHTRDSRGVRIDRLAHQIGISERQLHRRCCAALGYSVMTFARIVRFQRFLGDARGPAPHTLSQLAVESGYADQSHLTREVRRLTGLSPAQFVADLAR